MWIDSRKVKQTIAGRGMTMSQFIRVSGMSGTTLWHLGDGYKKVKDATGCAIAKNLGLPIDAIRANSAQIHSDITRMTEERAKAEAAGNDYSVGIIDMQLEKLKGILLSVCE